MFQLVKRFVQDTDFAVNYALVIKDYIDKYAEEVSEDTISSGPICYLLVLSPDGIRMKKNSKLFND